MIDRISRSFVHYTAYRQHMTTQLAISQAYEQRENLAAVQETSRAKALQSYQRKALTYSLVHAVEEANRIKYSYSPVSLGYVSPVVDADGYPYNGRYLDMKA